MLASARRASVRGGDRRATTGGLAGAGHALRLVEKMFFLLRCSNREPVLAIPVSTVKTSPLTHG
jgi:hypothetical protein